MLPLMGVIHLQVKHTWPTPCFDSPQVCQETDNVDLLLGSTLHVSIQGKATVYIVHDLKVIVHKFGHSLFKLINDVLISFIR